jgi:hypothetical protein
MGVREDIVSIQVPMTFRRRGGRKLIIAPDGSVGTPTKNVVIENALIRALAQAFRWHALFENGTYGSLDEIAKKENVAESYVSRTIRLTLLAPDIIEMILDDRQPESLTMRKLAVAFPLEWESQRRLFAIV